jgi:5-methylcytosine-specific restriction protein A
MAKRCDWTREELVLAVDVLVRREWRPVRAREPDAERLSAVLRALSIHPVADRPAKFRSSAAVQRKTYDIVTGAKDYSGTPTRGNTALERRVVADFRADPAAMHAEACRLRAAGGDATWRSPEA